MITQVFVQVKDATGEVSYYTIPNNLQTQYRDLCEKVDQIYEKNSLCLGLWGLAGLAGSIAAQVGFLFAVFTIDEDEDSDLRKASLPLLIGGIFISAISCCVIGRKNVPYNEAKSELDTFTKKIAQEALKVHTKGRGMQGIRRITQVQIPAGSPIISTSWGGELAIAVERAPSYQRAAREEPSDRGERTSRPPLLELQTTEGTALLGPENEPSEEKLPETA